MSAKRLALFVSFAVCLVAVGTHGASILDLFNWEEAEKLLGKQVQGGKEQDSTNRNCLCKGPSCICCVDLNITFVDLGGPGCVHMKYLSPDLGFAVNVSYGKSLLHSSTIKGADSPPICLDVFAKFAQMCARFSELAPTADGLRGCLQLEPRLLGDTQLEFPVGCFRSGPGGMQMEPERDQDDSQEESEHDAEGGEGEGEADVEEEENGENSAALNAEDILQVVNHTAEQGIAFFSSILGLAPPQRNSTSSAAPSDATSTPESVPVETQSRRGKILQTVQHPNVL